MNRYEILAAVVLVAIAIVYMIKSKWFDRLVKSLMKGSEPVTATDIKVEAGRVTEHIRSREEELKTAETNLRNEKKILKDL